MVKKYKLIKKYPGSKKLGTIVVDTNINNGAKDAYFSENWGKVNSGSAFFIGKQHNCENQPEFWEEVKEKEYEILSFRTPQNGKLPVGRNTLGTWYIYSDIAGRNFDRDDDWMIKNGYIIYSVKRLSDGEVFTVGDIVYETITDDKDARWTIKVFSLKDTMCFISGINIMYIEKYKQPLFTTEDGVDIYEKQLFYYIGDSWNICLTQCLFKGDGNFSKTKTFSTKNAAQKWIDENKPKYSKKAINNSINELFSPELSKDSSVFGEALMEGYREVFFKYLENEQT